MQRLFSGKDQKFIVGIRFNNVAGDFLLNMNLFSERTHMEMKVVHVVEDIFDLGFYYPQSWGGHDLLSIAKEERKKEIEAAEQAMRRLLDQKGIHPALGYENIEATNVCETLISQARAAGASLIAVGVESMLHKHLSNSMSVSLSLLSSSPLPVLVVRQGGSLDFARKRFRMVIADDFSARGLDVLASGLEFAAALGDTLILHLHVMNNGVMRKVFHKEFLNNAAKIESLEAETRNRVKESLLDRSSGFRAMLAETSCTYFTHVGEGDVLDEIASINSDFKPDLFVTGRHHALHTHPFGLGKLPMKALMSQCQGLLLVPER